MANNEPSPLSVNERNNRIFAIIWIVLEIIFCVMYAIWTHTSSYNAYTTGAMVEYLAALGIAASTIIGLGGLMTYVSGLKWSGFGFALLITALSYQVYFMANAFWTKADIQRTKIDISGNEVNDQQYYGWDWVLFVSEGFGHTIQTLGATATGAFKLAFTMTIAFSAIIGRAGPLEILIFVIFGGALYELNRQIIARVNYDVGGSITMFMFGGIQGTIVAILLGLTKQKEQLKQRQNYTSSRFNSTLAVVGSAFFWVFYPLFFLDQPIVGPINAKDTTPFLHTNAMLNAYWCISASVVTSLALSAVIHGRIRIKDLLYGTFAGAAMIGTSAPHIYNVVAAILLGMIAGLLQPVFNLIEEKIVKSTAIFTTCAPFVFAAQGLLGSLAAGVLRAIQPNSTEFNWSLNPYPFRWDVSGEYFRATFISFGIAIGSGVVCGLLCLLVTGQISRDYFDDIAYWIVRDDGLRPPKGNVKEEEEIKGVHSYIGA